MGPGCPLVRTMSFRSNKKASFVAPIHGRFFAVRAGVFFIFAMLAARLVYVQGVLRSDLQLRADRQCPVNVTQNSVRYRIADRNGSTLAETVEVASCFVDPSLVPNKPALAKKLAPMLGLSESALETKLRKAKGSFVWIKRDVPATVVPVIKEKKFPGVAFMQEKRRHYPMGVMAAHLLGFVGHEGVGLSGIESNLNQVLTPAVDDENVPAKKDARPVGNVQLTIDSSIQQICERELEWGAKKTGAKKAMVVVQNPWSGEILAMASWPPVSLDPDQPSPPGELRVPTIVDVFEPGSTFKVVTAAAAIEEKLVSDRDVFDGENGAWKVADITIHDHEPLRRMTFDDIIVHSSNIGTAKIAERIGSARLYQYARLFGFGVQPGTGLIGEAKGILRPPNKWSGVSKYVVSFGQEISVTAIQLVGAYSAIANGGVLMEPRIIKDIVSENGDVLWNQPAAEVRRVVAPETAKKLTSMLTKVVEKGTGVNAQIQWDPSTKVAGKTGTAQKWDSVRHRYHDLLALVSFCGFFPVDHPKLTMLVILDEPEGRRFGGLDAAPIFRRIAEQLSPRLLALENETGVSKPS